MDQQVLMFRNVVLPDDLLLGEIKWDRNYKLQLIRVQTLRLRVIKQETIYVV